MSVPTFKYTGMDNVSDPADVAITDAILLENMDPDNKSGVSTRDGRTLTMAGNFRSSYSDGKTCYVAQDNGIYSFDGSAISLIAPLSDPVTKVSFARVNDVVVFSNGTDFGVIENGVALTIPTPSADFKREMMPGWILAFMPPFLLSAVGNILYKSDPYRCDQMDERTNLFAMFRDEIRLVLPVDDGCYVVTTNETWWFGGTTFESQTQRLLASYGGSKGTGIITTGEKIPVLKLSGTVAIWTSVQGICAGGSGGNFSNLSAGKVSIDCSEEGCAMLREQNGLIHYVVSIGNNITPFNQYISPPLNVDIQDL